MGRTLNEKYVGEGKERIIEFGFREATAQRSCPSRSMKNVIPFAKSGPAGGRGRATASMRGGKGDLTLCPLLIHFRRFNILWTKRRMRYRVERRARAPAPLSSVHVDWAFEKIRPKSRSASLCCADTTLFCLKTSPPSVVGTEGKTKVCIA